MFSLRRHRISPYLLGSMSGRQPEVLLVFPPFFSSSVAWPFVHSSFRSWMHSAIFLPLCICNIWGRTIPECQKDCKILLPKVEQVFGCTHSASFIFSSPKGPREGQWLCRWCGRIWQLGSLHSPGPSSQVQRKGSARQQGPMALLALIQADTWGHASRARQALRHELSCLFLPGSSATERCSSGVPALS